MEKNCIYLVGNAHLDPVWMWRWQEGSMEAKATLRSALDRMQEFPHFRFVCSSASIFQWIEDFAPEMLEEIKERVAEGRFSIVGGWHVQPDCNLPSGEAFARQSLYAQRYFQNTFGKTAKVGYCVDSFGHCATLPMLLKNGGMDSYIFMRPKQFEKDMDSDIFAWVAPDGSRVIANRIWNEYGAVFDSMDALEQKLSDMEAGYRSNLSFAPFFYGVGNHGGGPTIRNLELLREYAEKHPEKKLIYSDLQDFFDHIRSSGQQIPQYRGELQHHASGCYAAEPRSKTAIRRAESDLVAAEAYGVMAQALCGKPAKPENYRKAWDAVCFSHFHDSMGGCSIKAVHDDTLDMLGMAKHIAAEEENSALQTISWKLDTNDRSLGQPLVVFNPHSFEVRDLVQVNGEFGVVRDAQGKRVPCQMVLSPVHACTNRSDTLFEAVVPSMGYRVYYLQKVDREKTTDSAVKAYLPDTEPGCHCTDGPVLENAYYRVVFENHTGYIQSFWDKRKEKELICDKAAKPVVFDEYYHDTWSHGKNFFSDVIGRFSDAQITVLEAGPVRATIKVVSRYNQSVLTQYFSLTADSDKLEVRGQIDWHEKHKLLKMFWPMQVDAPEAYYEIPYGVIQRPCDAEEEPGLRWTAVKGTNGGFALLNNNTYSSSVQGSTICQTLVRSPIFGDHGGPRTSESVYTAQGITEFCYAMMPVGETWNEVIKAGAVLNKGLTHILETWHPGKLSADLFSGLTVSAPNVLISAVKRSEDNKGMVLRVYETDGRETEFTASGDMLPCTLTARISPWSVQTWLLEDGTTQWKPVLFTEYAQQPEF